MAIPSTGAELSQDSAGESQVAGQGDAESDAFSDARLVKMVEVWSSLSEEVKGEILRLVGDDVDDLNDVTSEMA